MVLVSGSENEGVTEVVVTISNKDLVGASFDIRALLVAILPGLVQAIIDYLTQEKNEQQPQG